MRRCIALLFATLAFASTRAEAEQIIVSAAVSLTDVLAEIGKAYESKSVHRVRFNFGSSSELARQIEEGAPADVFVSADLEKMDALDKKRLVDTATRKNLLSNRLVLVIAVDSKAPIRTPRDLLRPQVKRIALAQPDTVPAGIYAKRYLDAEGLWGGVAAKVVPVLDVRAALASVEAGNVDAGFVYQTDAAISKKIKVVYSVPAEKGPKIVYPVAVIQASRYKEAARDFASFLSSPAGIAAFRKHGFIILE